MRIDVHSHYFPEEFVQTLLRMGIDQSIAERPTPNANVTLDERLGLLDEAGIDMQVISAASRQPYFAEEADAVEAARLGNDIYADVIKRYDRFEAFGCVPLPHVDAAIAEMSRCLDDLNFRGVTLGCSVNERQLDDEAFTPFWAEADRRGTVVFLHPMGCGFPGAEPYNLTWMLGAALEDSTAAIRLVMSGLTMRFPNVKIIIAHLGGFMPYLWQRIEGNRQITVDGVSERPSTLLRRLYYDTVNIYPPAIRFGCDTLGPERVMLGTDWPYPVGPALRRCVTDVEECGLPKEQVEAMLGGNAQQLLGIKDLAPR